ncbi:MAG: hypothetical protein J5902_00610, partial [Paludibacteraceae bacterium]|nr:hypothetical protein [Paludibacteraceae bacterium]
THFEWFTKQISEASRSNPEGISEASAMQPGQKRRSRGPMEMFVIYNRRLLGITADYWENAHITQADGHCPPALFVH